MFLRRRLVSTFRQQLQTWMPNLPVSISVGCALAPEHGNTAGELFLRADEALYKAKSKGKCQYKIYNPQDTYQTAIKTAGHTSIESEQQVGLNENMLIRQMFHNLYTSKNLAASVNGVFAFAGEYFNVSRVCIFENNADNTCCKNTFEWRNASYIWTKEQIEILSFLAEVLSVFLLKQRKET